MTISPIVILLLEDDDDDYLLSMSSVKKDRLVNHIFRVKDGVEGIQFLKKEGPGVADTSFEDSNGDAIRTPFNECPTPDIIIADLQMPRMGGRDFIIEVKKAREWRKIPIIVLTNSSDDKDVSELYEVGAAAYIVKPINAIEMGRVVKEIRDFYLSVVRLKGRN